jgi:adenylate cyclase
MSRLRPASRFPQLRRLALLLPLLLGLLHWAGAWRLDFVESFDHFLDDTRQRALLSTAADPRIVIVDVDEASLAEVGRWPWSRDRLAALTTELLQRQGAKAVGFNIVFSEPDPAEGLHLLGDLAAGPLRGDAAFQAEYTRRQPTLDHDARFADALRGQQAVLGFYLSSGARATRVGQLPPPVLAPAVTPLPGLTTWGSYGANLPALAQAAPRAGFFNVLPDSDGVVRSVPLLALWTPASATSPTAMPVAGPPQVHQAFALAVLRAVLGDPTVEPLRPGGPGGAQGLSAVRLHQGARVLDIPLDERGAVRVPFREAGHFSVVSATDVLAQRLPPGSLQGRLALVGTTALGLADLHATPVGAATPGVVIHASLIAGLLDGQLPTRPDWARGFEVASLILGCLALAWSLPRLHAAWAVALTGLSVLAWVALNLLLYHRQGWVLPLALPLLGTVATATLAIVAGYLAEGRSRRALARLFGAYVPPELVSQMALDPERYTRAGLGADNRELTVLFCDLRDFTRAAERLQPQQLREVVNLYFSRMSAVIARHGGTLDKYIGDAIMAFWGAPIESPDHAAQAVRAALDMLTALGPLNAELRRRGLPEIEMGIGLNTGLVCVGELGSDTRRSYTVIGDAVNLAARIEGLTRRLGVDLLVGEATYEAAKDATPDLPWRSVERAQVRGRAEPVTVYTPQR